jgi:uncharacterized protein (DUF1778 family)
VDEPKSDYNRWRRVDIRSLVELRDVLRNIQLSNYLNGLDRLEHFVLQSECSEAKDVINHIMKRK